MNRKSNRPYSEFPGRPPIRADDVVKPIVSRMIWADLVKARERDFEVPTPANAMDRVLTSENLALGMARKLYIDKAEITTATLGFVGMHETLVGDDVVDWQPLVTALDSYSLDFLVPARSRR